MDWDEYFIKQAMLASEKSKDPNTKVGCVIVGEDNVVLSIGFNGFPRGVHETHEEFFFENGQRKPKPNPTRLLENRWERPEKYNWIEHAERNAIYNAARHGIRLKGAKAYLNWMPIPCVDCTRALIQSGIVEIIGPDIPFPGQGAGVHYSLSQSNDMLYESLVKVRVVKW
jgi:dCMP deaminase